MKMMPPTTMSFAQKQMFIIIVIINLSLLHKTNCLECSEHLFGSTVNTTHMQFTKEIVSQEYAVLGQFKSLHCCAKGYRSIEWFKDDKPYPWPSDTSSLILYPAEANQTIYSRSTSLVDDGVYKCVLRNDTHNTEHRISLKVQVSSPDRPLATYKPHDQYVSIGEEARFFCEAFVGKVELPDARTEITWYRLFEDDQEQDMEGIQELVSREDGQIVGKYLTIPTVTKHSYGRYVCRFEMGNSAHQLEVSVWLFGTPISAADPIFLEAFILAILAAMFFILLVITIKRGRTLWSQHRHKNHRCAASTRESEEIGMRTV